MALSYVSLIVFSAIWVVVGAVLPWVIPKGPNRGIIQTMLVETAVCCYLFYICTWLMQLNPLVGPQIDNTTLWIMQKEWKS
jgi:V-type H+-transporting ATPase subunit e